MGSPKGGPQSSHLKPIYSTEDPRYKKLEEGRKRYHEEQRKKKRRREEYKSRLGEIKEQQLDIVQDSIDSGEIPEPAQLLMSMIKEQQLVLANPDLKPNESRAERALLLEMYKQYDKLTGASAPATSSVDVTSDNSEEMSEEDFAEQFRSFKVVD